VLGVLPGLMGTLQATEALKWILGVGSPLAGRLLAVDALAMRFQQVDVARDSDCAWCGRRTQRELLADYAAFCGEVPADAGAAAHASPPAARPAAPLEIEPTALATRLARGEPVLLLDVREEWEVGVASIEGARVLPMGLVPTQHSLLPRDREIAVVCHHGNRSAMVADYLRAAGFPQVMNVRGGIDRWSLEVDPSVPRY
jgi:adenylyltransferase/sulfurtransferase